MRYDLEDRTMKFAEGIIILCQKIPKNDINNPLINQLLRSGTSIGANYSEANGASSKRDFINKIYICKKESIETKYWLKLLAKVNPLLDEEINFIWKETHELTLIFSKIANN